MKHIKKIMVIALTVALSFLSFNIQQVNANTEVDIQNLNISSNTLQTYPNEDGSKKTVMLSMTFNSTANAKGKNYHFEIPYEDFTPGTNSAFENYTVSDPILEFTNIANQSGLSITGTQVVDYMEEGINKKKLIVSMNPIQESGSGTLALQFTVSDKYLGKISPGEIIWKNPRISLVDSSNSSVIKTLTADISLTSLSDRTYRQDFRKSSPSGTNTAYSIVNSNSIRYAYTYTRRNISNYERDTSYTPVIKIEMPIYLSINSSLLANDFFKGYLETESPDGKNRVYTLNLDTNHPFISSVSDLERTLSMILDIDPSIKPAIGTRFTVRTNFSFKHLNGKVITQSTSLNYQIGSQQTWNFEYTGEHYTQHVPGASIVNTGNPNYIAHLQAFTGSFNSFDHGRPLRNGGTVPVKGVSHYIYQDLSVAEKINIEAPSVYWMTSNAALEHQKFKINVTIMDSLNGSRVVEYNGDTSPIQDNRYMYYIRNLALASNEYIQKIEVVPMGSVSDSVEGDLLPGYAFSIRYKAKMWSNLKWHNGNEIDLTRTYALKMLSATEFINEDPAGRTYIKLKQFNTSYPNDNTLYHYYVPSNTTTLNFIPTFSDNSYFPGGTGKLKLGGYFLNQLTVGPWENPVILMKVSSNMRITNRNINVYTDKNTPINFEVSLMRTEGAFRYYKLSGVGNSLKENSLSNITDVTNLENLELDYVIEPGSAPSEGNKVYEIYFGGSNFDVFSRESGHLAYPESVEIPIEQSYYTGKSSTLGSNVINQYNLTGNEVNYKFVKSLAGSRNSDKSYTVLANTNAKSPSFTRPNENEPFTNTPYFAVEKNSNPEVKLTVDNLGNTVLNDVRLYTILNYTEDSDVTTNGNVLLKSLNYPANSIIYYNSELPQGYSGHASGLYNQANIGDWDEQTLQQMGFLILDSNTDLSTVKQLYLKIPEIAPNNSSDITLKYQVPDSYNITAVTQFRFYYASNSGNALVDKYENAPKTVFSTDLYQLNYGDSSGDLNVDNIPEYSWVQINQNRDPDKIAISQIEPSRIGHKFLGWVEEGVTPEVIYKYDSDNDYYNFTSQKPIANLIAKWEKLSQTIVFDTNTGIGSGPSNVTLPYGSSTTMPGSANVVKEGHSFIGWSQSSNSSSATYNPGMLYTNTTGDGTLTFYAVWQANKYDVQVVTEGSPVNPNNLISVTYNSTVSSSQLMTTRPGYTLKSWISEDGTPFIPDQTKVKNNLKIFAQWEAKLGEIVFKPNSGSGDDYSINSPHNEAVEIPYMSNQFTKTGYNFMGWNTKPDGSGVSYLNSEIAADRIYTFEHYGEKFNLYAQWEAKNLTITYHSNNGESLSSIQTFKYGNETALLDFVNGFSPVAKLPYGMIFSHWSTNVSGGNVYRPSQIVNYLNDVNLYAQFVGKPFTISFNGNGSSVNPDPIHAIHGATITLPSTNNLFYKEGYTLSGWSSDLNDTLATYSLGAHQFNTDGSDLTLYAVWTANSYEISYTDGSGNESYFKDQTEMGDYGSPTPGFKSTPQREGYTFVGWSPSVSATVKGNQEYVAMWRVTSYEISYTDGSGNESFFKDQTEMVDYGSPTPGFKSTPQREGYTFVGWSPSVSATVKGNQEYVAMWRVTSYEISYTDGSGDESYFKDQTEMGDYGSPTPGFKSTPQREGYTFVGWSPSVSATVTGNQEYVAMWRVNSYEISYTDGSGNESFFKDQTEMVDYGSPTPGFKSTPQREGYTFVGWSPSVSATVTGNQEYVAMWRVNSYEISYTDGSGNESYFKDQTEMGDYGSPTPGFKSTPQREGYTFIGWSPSVSATVTGNQEYVAMWKINTFKVNVYDSDMTLLDFIEVEYGEVISSITYDNKTGYSLGEWYDYKNMPIPLNSEIIVKEDLSIVVKYIPNVYEVIYLANGGSGLMEPQLFVYDQAAILKANNFVRKGYHFTGWKRINQAFERRMFNQALSNVYYNDVAEVMNLSQTGTVYLEAQWSPNEIMIEYISNGGSGYMPNQNIYYDSIFTLSPNMYSKDNHKFKYWSTSRDGLGKTYLPGEELINLSDGETLTLYAIWEDVSKEILPNTGVNTSLGYVDIVILGFALLFINKKRTNRIN